MDPNYNIPTGGFNQLRYYPGMPNYDVGSVFGPQSGSVVPQQPGNQQNFADKFGPMQTQVPNLGVKGNSGPQYTMQSKHVFGEINYPWLQTEQALQGVGSLFRQSRLQKEARDYQHLQSNPLYQIPTNPNTSQQSLYGSQQYRLGGYAQGGDPLADMSDFISHSVASGDVNSDYSKNLFTNVQGQIGQQKARDLFNAIYLYNKRDDVQKLSPEDKITKFFSMRSQNSNVSDVQDKLRNFDYSPTQAYRDSPDINIEKLQGKGMLAKRAEGGPNFDDFSTFDEEDFEDLKDDIEKYNKGKEEPTPEAPEPEQKEEVQEPEEPEEQDEPEAPMDWDKFLEPKKPAEEDDDEPTSETSEGIPNIGSSGITPGATSMPDMSDHPLLQSFKNGIANSEGADYFTGNKHSSAFGKYQITSGTREGIRQQFFPNITRDNFETTYKEDPKFQERVMDVYGQHLISQYGDPHKAAIAYYLGPGKADMVNNRDYRPNQNNETVGKYLDTFDKGYSKKKGGQIYEEGGEYDLTDLQIEQLRKQGYQIEKI